MKQEFNEFGSPIDLEGGIGFDEDNFPMNHKYDDAYPPDSDLGNKNEFIVEYEMSLMLSAEECGELAALAKILRVPQPVIQVRIKEHNERMSALEEQLFSPSDPEQYFGLDGANENTILDVNFKPILFDSALVINDERDNYQRFCMCGADQTGGCVCEFADSQDLPETGFMIGRNESCRLKNLYIQDKKVLPHRVKDNQRTPRLIMITPHSHIQVSSSTASI